MAILDKTQLSIIARTIMPELYRLQAHEDRKKELRGEGISEGTIEWVDALYWLTRKPGELDGFSSNLYEQRTQARGLAD